eukprot:5730215-Amphidinium_carterae.1
MRYISGFPTTSIARTGADDDERTIGNINETETEPYDEWKDYNGENEEYYEECNEEDVKCIVAMVNKGKGKRKGKNMGKGKDKGGKDSKTVTCYTRGQQGYISPNCPTKKRNKGKGKKGPYNAQWYEGKGYGQPQSHGYQQQGYSGYSGQPLNTGQPGAN